MDEALLVRPVAGDSAGNRRNGVIRDLEILPLVFVLPSCLKCLFWMLVLVNCHDDPEACTCLNMCMYIFRVPPDCLSKHFPL